jgi:hypothetical protein
LVWLGLARIAVLRLPFRLIEPRLGQRMAESSQEIAGGEPAGRIGWAIRAAARRTPWRSRCLEQAIAGKIMLRRRRIPSTMYLGVAVPFEAHAWLRVGTVNVIGGGDLERYAVLATFADPERP